MRSIYYKQRAWAPILLLLTAVLVSLPIIVVAKQQFNKVTNLEAEYSAEDEVVRVSWDHTSTTAEYQVKVISGGEKIDSKSTTKQHANFDAALFTNGTDYTIQVRVKKSNKKTASGWKKITYTHTTADPCPTDGINHEVYVTSSTSPTSFPDATTAAITKASVPDAVLLEQDTAAGNTGDILMYFIRDGICMAKSEDNGTTWSDPLAVSFAGLDETIGAYDPSLVQLSDGSLRMYFYASTVLDGDPASMEGTHPIYSAVSADGINFTMDDGERLSLESITDPEVIYFNDAWIMYVSSGSSTFIATSTDGLNFTLNAMAWPGGGIPGAYVDTTNMVHIYGCSGGVNTASSFDGITFGATTMSVIPATADATTCDPSPVLLSNGTILMVYKKQTTSGDNEGSK